MSDSTGFEIFHKPTTTRYSQPSVVVKSYGSILISSSALALMSWATGTKFTVLLDSSKKIAAFVESASGDFTVGTQGTFNCVALARQLGRESFRASLDDESFGGPALIFSYGA